MNAFPFPHPPQDPLSQPHWDGARQNRLMVQQCEQCGRSRFPATSACPYCGGGPSRWIACSGYGTLESFCVFHKAYWPGAAGALPYTVIQVLLDEGVRFMSNPAGMSREPPRIGMRVRASFEEAAPGLTLVRFAPAETK